MSYFSDITRYLSFSYCVSHKKASVTYWPFSEDRMVKNMCGMGMHDAFTTNLVCCLIINVLLRQRHWGKNHISQVILIFLRTQLNPVGVSHWALG